VICAWRRTSSRFARRHFEAEYGPGVAPDGADADALVTFVGREAGAPERYKSVRWAFQSQKPAARFARRSACAGGLALLGSHSCSDTSWRPFTSGKSSVAARILAAGHAFLGDDQILLDAAGDESRFPPPPEVLF